ncbi:MAG: hypothetical protein E6X32_03095 [Varibaculum cambriense]|nr:hypothetical protein [Varibaculum cambriense]
MEKPAAVTCDGKGIYTTSIAQDSPSQPTQSSQNTTENAESAETNPPTP